MGFAIGILKQTTTETERKSTKHPERITHNFWSVSSFLILTENNKQKNSSNT